MNRLDILEMCEGNPTKYDNLYYHNSSVFEFVYVGEEFIVEARNCRDLKFKLSLKGITLHERQVPKLSSEVSRLNDVDAGFVRASEMELEDEAHQTDKIETKVRTVPKRTTSFSRLYGTSPRELALRQEMANRYH